MLKNGIDQLIFNDDFAELFVSHLLRSVLFDKLVCKMMCRIKDLSNEADLCF